MRNRIRENIKDTAIATTVIWLVLIGVSAIYIARGINTEVAAVQIPSLSRPSPPAFAYYRSSAARQNLHEPPIQRTARFSVMIPFDTAPDANPIPLDENPDDPLHRTYQDMQSLAEFGTIPDSVRESKETGQITWKRNSVSMNDSSIFLGRLLQYYILASIDSLQHNMLITYVGLPAEAQAGIEPPDGELYPDDKLSQMLANNRFFRPFVYRPSVGGIKRMKLPRGTTVEFKEDGNPPGKYFVVLRRTNYFNVEFEIESFAGTGIGNLPKHFATAHASTTMQWSYFVTMRYSIEHPDDSFFNPGRYAEWLDVLYEALSNKMKAPTN